MNESNLATKEVAICNKALQLRDGPLALSCTASTPYRIAQTRLQHRKKLCESTRDPKKIRTALNHPYSFDHMTFQEFEDLVLYKSPGKER